MSEPERLLDGRLPSDVASLLRSAESDDPVAIDEKRARLLAVAASTSPLASALPRTGSNALPQSGSNALRKVGWFALAAAVITGGAIGFDALRDEGEHVATTAVPDVPMTTAHAEPSTAEPSISSPVVVPSLHIDELPTAVPPASARVAVTSEPRAVRPETVTVEDELKAIDAARAALSARRPDEALARVQRYRVTFRDPHFVAEADALEVQALAGLGRTEEARVRAERFLRTHPGSPYTQRVRTAARLDAHGE